MDGGLGGRQKVAITSLGVAAVVFTGLVGARFARQHNLTPTHRPGAMVVQVSGAVNNPGVYEFSQGARVEEAIQAAGGFKRDADTGRVNQAEQLRDAVRYNVPRVGDPEEPNMVADPTINPAPVAGLTSSFTKKETPISGSISLNNSTSQQLEGLPGVGPATAQKIIEYRTQHGGFRTIEELQEVKGIGPKKFAKMRPYLAL